MERCTAARLVASRVVVATTCRAVLSCLGESCAHLLLNQRLGQAALCVASTHAEPHSSMGCHADDVLCALAYLFKFEQIRNKFVSISNFARSDGGLEPAEMSRAPHWSENTP